MAGEQQLESGFYWVMYEGEKQLALWDGEDWGIFTGAQIIGPSYIAAPVSGLLMKDERYRR